MNEEWTLIDCLHGWREVDDFTLPDTERTFDGPGLAEWSTDDKVPREVRVKVVRAERAEQAEAQVHVEQMEWNKLRAKLGKAEAALRELRAAARPFADQRDSVHIDTLEWHRKRLRAALSDEGANDG